MIARFLEIIYNGYCGLNPLWDGIEQGKYNYAGS